MKRIDENIKKLAITADLSNTLGGGMSEPRVQFHKREGYHEVEVNIPGVSEDKIKVEIHNNWLTIFHILEVPSGEMVVHVPRMIFSQAIPYFIDIEKIAAKFDNNQLIVHLPFNERANGYHRKIRIKQ